MITIIGIGVTSGDITVKAAKIIAKEKNVFLRSAKTAAGRAVANEYPHVIPLDDCFVNAESFDSLANEVCKKISDAAKNGNAVYLTDGAGTDSVSCALMREFPDSEIIYGVSPHRAKGTETSEITLTATDAVRIKPYLDTALPLRILEIDDKYSAGDLKLWLMDYYGDDDVITVYIKGKVLNIPLCELDRLSGYDYSCELYIAPQNTFFKKRYSFADLMRIMQGLTAADGCPWDKAQTHESIRVNMIEEAYEAVDAIDSGDIDAMTEELGDVMLQSVFHCDMGRRFGEFTLSDVISGLCNKLVTRHTHIFGKNKATDAESALGFWEAAKAEEKQYVSTADKLNRLPESFPALLAAQKAYKKLAKANVTLSSEELSSMANITPATERDYGKKLFALSASASNNNVDAEVALNAFVAEIKKTFEKAEKNGNTADFLRKL